MKKLFFAFFAVLFAVSAVAQTGLTCEDPIPVDKSYTGNVEVDPEVGYKELWYTANTYDLPMHVYFSPDSACSTMSPEVYIDFSCTTGVYDDPKLDSLLVKASVFGVELPIEFMCDRIFRNGKTEWDLSVSKSYREKLAESGITYNVKALIRVVYYEGGSISLTPDTSFTSCMNNEYVQLGDTIEILPNDSDRVFVMPFTDWQHDSIQFVWEGEQDANVWFAVQYCEFTPGNSSFIWGNYELSAGNPHKLQATEIVDIIKENKEGGVYYGKVTSPVAGKLVVEKIPMAPIKGGATLLEYGKSVKVNDENQLFCFPRTWKATEFISTANSSIALYMSSSPDFTPSIDDANLIANHSFSQIGGQYRNYISNTEMSNVIKSIDEDYVYVRFQCAAQTTIAVAPWDASSCANKSLMIRPNQTLFVAAKSQSTIYRMLYEDWKNCNVTIEWTGSSSSLPTYIADTCAFVLSKTSPRVLQYASVKRDGVFEIDTATIASWESRVDSDGYLYVRFNPNNKGNVKFAAEKLVEEPEPISPCVANSIELKAGDQITLNLDSAFTVYRINYAEWVAQNVTFQWTGETDLHTFLAETCQFAVAPYNRYVVDNVAIPAKGEFVLDVETLSAFADKVDADGYLYIRFLTEKEGSLSVTNY